MSGDGQPARALTSPCTLAGSPWRRRLVDDVRERLFTPRAPDAPRRIGAEVELIPLREGDDSPVAIEDTPAGTGTLAVLDRLARERGWHLEPGAHGVPALHTGDGGTVSFEPGGQIEYATAPRETVARLAGDLDRVLPALVAAADEAGIRLVGCGIDPSNALDRARLLLPGRRYQAMHRYLSAIGDAGPRMMLQTAAIQVNIELDAPGGGSAADHLRWRTLNAAAPFITAIFANSSRYAGEDSGYASYRARQWRLLDRRRTGVLGREPDPAEEYTDFALEAGWIFAPEDREPEPFAEFLLRGEVTLEDWRLHLTTLFPEIRPRGFLEVRCIDALPPEWAVVPAAFLAGLVADARALGEATDVVGEPDSMLLQDAARAGLRDPRLARGALDLFDIALRGAARTGRVEGDALDAAARFRESYTALGRSPGDEGVGAAA